MKLLKYVFCFLVLCFLTQVYAQDAKYKFPQKLNFKNCIKPGQGDDKMVADIKKKFDDYKKTFLTKSNRNNGYYVLAEGNGPTQNSKTATCSEAHGYGMVIYALMAGYEPEAKTIYDGFIKFWKTHPSCKGGPLMAWYTADTEDNPADATAASDGDFDIAYSLLIADKQWGSTGTYNYLQEAKDLLVAIKKKEMGSNSKRVLLGDWVENQNDSRSSDWFLDHMRAFGVVTSDASFWDAAVAEVYQIYKEVAKPNVGLVCDFITGDPARPDPVGGGTNEDDADAYSYNGCRNPLRLAVDYAHYGKAETKSLLTTINTWLKGKTNNDVSKIMAGYDLNGNVLPKIDYNDACFLGPFIAGMIVDPSNQDYLTKGWQCLDTITTIFENKPDAYQDALRILCMLIMSGNWWNPMDPPSTAIMNKPGLNMGQTILKNPTAVYDIRGRKLSTAKTVLAGSNSYASTILLVQESNGFVRKIINKR
ncbi:MAG: hypothetical protein JW795_18900 [Chitinivibrionales bacterium]|nr:hypothetical protein [Chitinivibrionales bacterium]